MLGSIMSKHCLLNSMGTCWFLTDGPPFYSFIWKHPQTGFLAQGQQEGGKTVLILWRSGWFLTSLRFPAKDPS